MHAGYVSHVDAPLAVSTQDREFVPHIMVKKEPASLIFLSSTYCNMHIKKLINHKNHWINTNPSVWDLDPITNNGLHHNI
jgi:hypothetical protein